MSFIDVTQYRSERLNDKTQNIEYVVNTLVTRAVGIDSNVFVFKVTDNSFQYVATLYDMKKWPITREEAISKTFDFYRKDQVEVFFPTVVVADEAAKHHLSRISLLRKDWDAQSTNFVGTTVVTIKGT